MKCYKNATKIPIQLYAHNTYLILLRILPGLVFHLILTQLSHFHGTTSVQVTVQTSTHWYTSEAARTWQQRQPLGPVLWTTGHVPPYGLPLPLQCNFRRNGHRPWPLSSSDRIDSSYVNNLFRTICPVDHSNVRRNAP